MPFRIRPYRRSPVQCAVTYNAGPFQGQGTVRCGISPVPVGDSPVICACDQGKPSRSPSRSRMSNASQYQKPWSAGREGKSVRWRMSRSSHTPALDSSAK